MQAGRCRREQPWVGRTAPASGSQRLCPSVREGRPCGGRAPGRQRPRLRARCRGPEPGRGDGSPPKQMLSFPGVQTGALPAKVVPAGGCTLGPGGNARSPRLWYTGCALGAPASIFRMVCCPPGITHFPRCLNGVCVPPNHVLIVGPPSGRGQCPPPPGCFCCFSP